MIDTFTDFLKCMTNLHYYIYYLKYGDTFNIMNLMIHYF